jgi:hypothetical protein
VCLVFPWILWACSSFLHLSIRFHSHIFKMVQLATFLLTFSFITTVLSLHPYDRRPYRRQISFANSTLPGGAAAAVAAANSNANSTIIIIKDNETSSSPLDQQCAQITALTALSSLSTNSSLLASVTSQNNLTTSQIAALQAQAQNASMQLGMLTSSNATLAGTCATATQVSRDCAELKGLSILADTVSDPAKLSALTMMQNLTTAQVEELKTDATNTAPLLATLKANTTLVTECAKFDSARAMGQGIAESAGLATGALAQANPNVGNGTAAAAGNVTVTSPSTSVSGSASSSVSALGAAGSTGSVVSPAAAVSSSPIASTNMAGGVRIRYGALGTMIGVMIGFAFLG